jgi:hypothetical protein
MNRPAKGTVQAKPVTPHPPSSADFDIERDREGEYICDRVANNCSAIVFTGPAHNLHKFLTGFRSKAAKTEMDTEDATEGSTSAHDCAS